MFGVMMTASQMFISRYPSGNGFPTAGQNLMPLYANSSWMCGSQVIQRDDFTSFDMVAVIVILAVGGVFIFLDLTLQPLVHAIHARRKRRPGAIRRGFCRDKNWKYSSIYHTQGFAYQAMGLGTWKDEAIVPTTKNQEIFRPIWTYFDDVTTDGKPLLSSPMRGRVLIRTCRPEPNGQRRIRYREARVRFFGDDKNGRLSRRPKVRRNDVRAQGDSFSGHEFDQ